MFVYAYIYKPETACYHSNNVSITIRDGEQSGSLDFYTYFTIQVRSIIPQKFLIMLIQEKIKQYMRFGLFRDLFSQALGKCIVVK